MLGWISSMFVLHESKRFEMHSRNSIRGYVRRSVGQSVRPSHKSWISDISTEMKQNSTKYMMLRHLKVIKAKIEQKSIHIMKLPFEGPFKNKYAGRSPERILCLYSVRLVSWATLISIRCDTFNCTLPLSCCACFVVFLTRSLNSTVFAEKKESIVIHTPIYAWCRRCR